MSSAKDYVSCFYAGKRRVLLFASTRRNLKISLMSDISFKKNNKATEIISFAWP